MTISWSKPAMRWVVILVGLSACGSSSTAAVANAALNTSLAVAVAGVQRAQGGCYATCTHGLVCNHATGRCEERPCDRGCGSGQFCDNGPGHTPMCRELPPPSQSITPPTPPTPTPPPSTAGTAPSPP